mgnify:FL=1
MNQLIIDEAITYKRKVAGSFQSITPEDISSKIAGTELIVTTKIDGEYNYLYFDGQIVTLMQKTEQIGHL